MQLYVIVCSCGFLAGALGFPRCVWSIRIFFVHTFFHHCIPCRASHAGMQMTSCWCFVRYSSFQPDLRSDALLALIMGPSSREHKSAGDWLAACASCVSRCFRLLLTRFFVKVFLLPNGILFLILIWANHLSWGFSFSRIWGIASPTLSWALTSTFSCTPRSPWCQALGCIRNEMMSRSKLSYCIWNCAGGGLVLFHYGEPVLE